MNVTEIPFNALLKMQTAPAGSPYVLQLPDSQAYLNHVGTVHASAQLALAEASSGQMLIAALPGLAEQVVGVVRRVDAKFKKPMQGAVFAKPITPADEIRTAAEPLAAKGRAIVPVTVEVVDRDNNVGVTVTFEWFVTKR